MKSLQPNCLARPPKLSVACKDALFLGYSSEPAALPGKNVQALWRLEEVRAQNLNRFSQPPMSGCIRVRSE